MKKDEIKQYIVIFGIIIAVIVVSVWIDKSLR